MRILWLLGALLLVAACDTTRPLKELHGIAAPDDAFRAALAVAYSEYAQEKQNNYDWWDSKYFAEKGLNVVAGTIVEPEMPDHWHVASEHRSKLLEARHQLNGALKALSQQRPEQAAAAIVAYDRWLVLTSEGWDTKHIQQAQRAFRKAFKQLRSTARPTKRFRHSSASAAHNDYRLGVAYFQGHLYPKDHTKAVEYFKKSANAGNAYGQYSLAYMYSEGLGVPQSWEIANEWLMKAANQGHARAMDDLGVSYGNGRGITQDWVESYKWISLAARYGDKQAARDLEYAKARMTPDQIVVAQKRADEWQKLNGLNAR